MRSRRGARIVAALGLAALSTMIVGDTTSSRRPAADVQRAAADMQHAAADAQHAAADMQRPTADAQRPDAAVGPVASPAPSPAVTVATVGPLFQSGLDAEHTCTAGVVDSPAGDIIVTAAHCISGTGAGTVFAPGYADGTAPYGSWTVQAAYVAPGWLQDGDPSADLAFLVVAPAATNATPAPVQDVVGGNVLGPAPTAGEHVTVAGYVVGIDDAPVVCSASVYLTDDYPSFDCPGYAGGTSGSPWLSDYDPATGAGVITAVIGGLDHGGCSPSTSYSSPFSETVAEVFGRAVSGAPADDVDTYGSSAC